MSAWLASLSTTAAAALETATQSDTFAFIKDASAKVAATVEEKAEAVYSSTTTMAEKQLHHASIALLHSEIAEKKREWGERAWNKMKDGDMVAVTAVFENSLREIEQLEQQIEAKTRQIAELDAGAAVVQPPETRRVAQLPTMGGESPADHAASGAGAGGGGIGVEGRVDRLAREAREAREAAAATVSGADGAAPAAPASVATVVIDDEQGAGDEILGDDVQTVPLASPPQPPQATAMADTAPPPRPGLADDDAEGGGTESSQPPAATKAEAPQVD